ncbi:YcbK family protein [Oceanicella actignis]|uniref:Murein endopeptidase K n=1 Tax=Oceanicella actignis TaxID=1189325 RepID=A0A1M7THD2_9RHOB|nr:DUF882 domain-containing protein [Oceanicella actignis]TYO88461.1 uncharacterized protein YcbK (DUF882 family) [Oceanicella actignis]SET59040.1 Uncharacterized conserved protein YcbK, DUF882 family [Oceanicella actignis]SHN70120.1 Uncharacterized conserved protein YcbK, DUF882 family [Oceanicella actignis]
MTMDQRLTRRGLLGLIGAGAALAAAPGLAAPATLRGKGDYRAIHLFSSRLGESVNTVYWIDGEYIPEALDEISHLLRDWRQDLVKPIDPRVIDILAEAHRKLDAAEPFEVVSGYRSPQTNAMLRRRSSGVARNSYHIKAMAADVTMRSRSVEQMYRAGLSCHGGGVGRYSRSGFVHMDCGPVRSWGR